VVLGRPLRRGDRLLLDRFEFAHSGEASRFIQDFIEVPGTAILHPIGIQALHRRQQSAVRMVYQFGDNAWVHPYVNAGYVFDADRRRYYSPPQYYYPGDPRTRPAVLLRPELNGERHHEYQHGVTAGGGARFFVSTNAYINTGFQWSFARPARTITFFGGFGVEF
jgi:hypothetical protein